MINDPLEYNKSIAKLFLCEMYTNWRYEIVNDIVHDDYFISRNSVAIINNLNSMPTGTGKKNMKKRVQYFRKAIPDSNYDIIKMVAEGDEVIAWWIWTGTQEGELFGFPASNQPFRIFGTNLFTIKEGKIVNTLVTFDSFSMLIQLGHVDLESAENVFLIQYLKNIEKISEDMGLYK